MIHWSYTYSTRVFYYDPSLVPWDSWAFAVVNPYFRKAKASLFLYYHWFSWNTSCPNVQSNKSYHSIYPIPNSFLWLMTMWCGGLWQSVQCSVFRWGWHTVPVLTCWWLFLVTSTSSVYKKLYGYNRFKYSKCIKIYI